MRYEQTREILQKLAPDYHRKVSLFYEQLAECKVAPRVRLMLDYLIDHEQQRALALDEFCQEAPKQVLDYWFKGVEINFPRPKADLLPETAGSDLDQLISAAIGYKKELISYFDHLLEHTTSPEPMNLIITLKTQEEKAMKRMIRHSQGLADL